MRKLSLLILVILIPLFSYSQVRERLLFNDLYRYQLKGKVKSLTHHEYEPNYTSDSTYTLEIYDFILPHNYKLVFNKAGYIDKRIEYKLEGDSLIIEAVKEFNYNSKNQIVSEVRKPAIPGRDTTKWVYERIDKNTTLVKQIDNTFDTLYYQYTQNGNKEILRHANADSSYQTKFLFVYDNQNRLIRKEEYEDQEFIKDLKVYSYRDSTSQKLLYKLRHSMDDHFQAITRYKYNEQGHITKTIGRNLKLKDSATKRFEYKYDSHGNWIEKRCYNPSGKIYTVYKRQIDYYKD